MIHPGWHLANKLKEYGRTQKQLADLLGKRVSELNELINGKRNITIQRDILLSIAFDQKAFYWIGLQNEYDYSIAKMKLDPKKIRSIKKKKNQIAKQHVFSRF